MVSLPTPTLLLKPPPPSLSPLLSSHLPRNPQSEGINLSKTQNHISYPLMASSSSSRWPSFSAADDGLASIAGTNPYAHRHLFVSRTGCYSAAAPRRRGSLRSLASLTSSAAAACSSSPRSIPGRIFDTRLDEATINPPHFLDSCFLCKKPLGGNRDIFMYRGDIPFCSEECRKEQIDMDEAMEKSRSLSSMKAMRNKQKDSSSAQQNAASSPGKSQKYLFRAGIAAA